MTLRRTLLSALALIAGLTIAAYALRVPLSLAVARRVADSRFAADAMTALPDGLHVGLCGAGSPFPDDRRAGPCTLVLAGQRLFIFDAGSGATRNIGKLGFNTGRIEAIFLTHFHSDHIDGLGELLLQRWVAGANQLPVDLHGPAGVERVLGGLMQAYAVDSGYRVAHHGNATLPASGFGGAAKPFTPGADGRVVLLKDADLEVVAFNVDHAPVHPAVGYRIQYKGRSVVLSGDTRQSAAVQREAAGVDLLVHEALSPKLVAALSSAAEKAGRTHLKKIFGDIVDYHATPEQAAETARDAKVGYLLFNHIVPVVPPLPGLETAFMGDAGKIYGGPVRLGIDGDFISMLPGTQDVQHSRRF